VRPWGRYNHLRRRSLVEECRWGAPQRVRLESILATWRVRSLRIASAGATAGLDTGASGVRPVGQQSHVGRALTSISAGNEQDC
jgi:hypothetical protein